MRIERLHGRPRDAAELGRLLDQGWPPFISADLEADTFVPVVRERFADLELIAIDDGCYLGAGWAVPITWDGTGSDLPSGYTDSLRRAITLSDAGGQPNTLVVCAAQIDEAERGRGFAADLLKAFRDVARSPGLDRLIVPLRPTAKARYPLTPIERYALWTRPDGAPFDPWLRTHWRMGARVIGFAPESQTMVGSTADWEGRTGLALTTSERR